MLKLWYQLHRNIVDAKISDEITGSNLFERIRPYVKEYIESIIPIDHQSIFWILFEEYYSETRNV